MKKTSSSPLIPYGWKILWEKAFANWRNLAKKFRGLLIGNVGKFYYASTCTSTNIHGKTLLEGGVFVSDYTCILI